MRKLYRRWILRRRIKRTIRLLKKIDKMMKNQGMPRWKRKQIWHDFIKSSEGRNRLIEMLNEAK